MESPNKSLNSRTKGKCKVGITCERRCDPAPIPLLGLWQIETLPALADGFVGSDNEGEGDEMFVSVSDDAPDQADDDKSCNRGYWVRRQNYASKLTTKTLEMQALGSWAEQFHASLG